MKAKLKRSNKQWIITAEVFQDIKDTIGRVRPESGGILGSSDGVHIDHYYFDRTAITSGASYQMDHEKLNEVIHEWNDTGAARFVGVIHSHPFGFNRPSEGDRLLAMEIIETMDVDGELFTPIVQVGPKLNGNINIFPYSFCSSVELMEQPITIEKVTSKERRQKMMHEKAPHRFERISSILPEKVMSEKCIICVGCGGSRSFLEMMARSGVGNFVLIDDDKVEDTNIATQNVYISDIGCLKADLIKKRLEDINPYVNVTVIDRRIDDMVTDREFSQWTNIKDFKTKDILLCGCTDNFWAQDRCAKLSLEFGIPYLAAQIFKGGWGHEVIFTYPGLTESCPRCMLESRYRNVEDHPRDVEGESGHCPVFVTEHLNAVKSSFALYMLCFNDKSTAYYKKLQRFAKKNYIMTRLSEDDQPGTVFDDLKNMPEDLAFPLTTIAIEQTPEENCMMCRNVKDLSKLIGTFGDTRNVRRSV